MEALNSDTVLWKDGAARGVENKHFHRFEPGKSKQTRNEIIKQNLRSQTKMPTQNAGERERKWNEKIYKKWVSSDTKVNKGSHRSGCERINSLVVNRQATTCSALTSIAPSRSRRSVGRNCECVTRAHTHTHSDTYLLGPAKRVQHDDDDGRGDGIFFFVSTQTQAREEKYTKTTERWLKNLAQTLWYDMCPDGQAGATTR